MMHTLFWFAKEWTDGQWLNSVMFDKRSVMWTAFAEIAEQHPFEVFGKALLFWLYGVVTLLDMLHWIWTPNFDVWSADGQFHSVRECQDGHAIPIVQWTRVLLFVLVIQRKVGLERTGRKYESMSQYLFSAKISAVTRPLNLCAYLCVIKSHT